MTDISDPQQGEVVLETLAELSSEFDAACQQRHVMGEEKYGPGTWLGIDTFEAALDELVDLANYIRFTYIKIRLLQEALDGDGSTPTPLPGNERMGKESQVPTQSENVHGFVSLSQRKRT